MLAFATAVALVVAGMLGLSWLLGERHAERSTGYPYESGILRRDAGPPPAAPRFYVVAMLFVIFDLEAALLFAWAAAFRDLGWSGYLGAMGFLGILLVALFYEWRMGALDWAASERVPRPNPAPEGRR